MSPFLDDSPSVILLHLTITRQLFAEWVTLRITHVPNTTREQRYEIVDFYDMKLARILHRSIHLLMLIPPHLVF